MNDVTGIIVSYNTKDLLKNCVESIRRFYPALTLIIIDGSCAKNTCYEYSKSLNSESTRCVNVEHNIGHGLGMKLGISLCQTKYFLLIDSDTVMISPPIEQMRRLMSANFYGVGKVILVDKAGGNSKYNQIPYLHPYFAMIDREKYFKYSPIIHHGAPLINSMIDLSKRKRSPALKDFDLDNYVIHLERGTRLLNPPDFHPQTWAQIAY